MRAMMSATVGALVTVVSVAELVGSVSVLIVKIKRAVDMARQNVEECRLLAERVSEIKEEPLRHLRQEESPAVGLTMVQPLLVRLRDTLEEAHNLVVSCSGADNTGITKLFTAEKFKQVHGKIDSRLRVFPVISQILQIQQLAESPSGSSTSSRDPHVDVAAITKRFTWAEIAEATNNFSSSTVLRRQGSSGTVYKGHCLDDGRDVAIKFLRNGRQDAEDTFVTELEILSPLRHGNIVSLLGWCSEEVHAPAQPPQRMLVYEYMPKGTLRDHLLLLGGSTSPVTTSWTARVEVLLGASRAIRHLHCDATPRVIHLDVTSSSILLDATWMPRLSGFGKSVLLACTDDDGEHQLGGGGGQSVAKAMGEFGYIDPVYQRTKMVRPATDVYSFGVVMLEALTGKPPVDASNHTLASSLPRIIDSGRLRNELDLRPAPNPTPSQLQALQLVADTAVRCLWPENRPDIGYVVTNLEKALSELTTL